MNIIKVADFCSNAITLEDGQKIRMELEPYFKENQEVTLDFSGVSKFVTLFFNNCTGYYILNNSPQKYDELLKVENLSTLGESVYLFSRENAIKIYNDRLSKAQEEKIEKFSESNIKGE